MVLTETGSAAEMEASHHTTWWSGGLSILSSLWQTKGKVWKVAIETASAAGAAGRRGGRAVPLSVRWKQLIS